VDSRVSIGIGSIGRLVENAIVESTGPAFELSGRGLDTLPKHLRMNLSTDPAHEELPLLVAALHGSVDAVKAHQKDIPLTFAVDQAAHIGLLGGIAWVLSDSGITLTPNPGYAVLVWVAGFVAVTRGAGFAVSKVAKQLTEINGLEIDGLQHGGACIGTLERTLIFLLILIGQPGAIGFLVAAKSILRFEEAKKQKLAEYVLIGTLLSFTLAISLTFLTMKAAAL